jgi:site-specific recombinase XerD
LVFTTSEDTMIDTDNFRSRIFGPAAKRAGLNDGVTLMDLRHTAASNLIASGADIVTVAFYTGHSVQVLMSTYVHELEEALRRAAERMYEIIRAELPTGG